MYHIWCQTREPIPLSELFQSPPSSSSVDISSLLSPGSSPPYIPFSPPQDTNPEDSAMAAQEAQLPSIHMP